MHSFFAYPKGFKQKREQGAAPLHASQMDRNRMRPPFCCLLFHYKKLIVANKLLSPVFFVDEHYGSDVDLAATGCTQQGIGYFATRGRAIVDYCLVVDIAGKAAEFKLRPIIAAISYNYKLLAQHKPRYVNGASGVAFEIEPEFGNDFGLIIKCLVATIGSDGKPYHTSLAGLNYQCVVGKKSRTTFAAYGSCGIFG